MNKQSNPIKKVNYIFDIYKQKLRRENQTINFNTIKNQLILGSFLTITLDQLENNKKRMHRFQGQLISLKKQGTFIESLKMQLILNGVIIIYSIPSQIILKLSINNLTVSKKN